MDYSLTACKLHSGLSALFSKFEVAGSQINAEIKKSLQWVEQSCEAEQWKVQISSLV